MPGEAEHPRPRRVGRHEPFTSALEKIGTKRNPLWQVTAAGLLLCRFMDSWALMGPTFMRWPSETAKERRQVVEEVGEQWSDLRESLLLAFDTLALKGVSADAEISTATTRAIWLKAVYALADAADSYQKHGLPDRASDMYQLVLDRLPPSEGKRAIRRSQAVEEIAERCRSAISQIEEQSGDV